MFPQLNKRKRGLLLRLQQEKVMLHENKSYWRPLVREMGCDIHGSTVILVKRA